MFYRAGGCSIRESLLLCLGVRIGAIWPDIPQWAAARIVLPGEEIDDEQRIESRVDAALAAVTQMNVGLF